MTSSSFVRIDGVPHHVAVTGTGPVCVLSAGLGLAWFDWDPVVELLSPSRTVVRFDRPGLGLSAPAREAPTLAGEAARIGAVLDAVGLGGRPVTVVGHSLAGFHCEAFARLCPERTAGLVLVDSSVEETARPPRCLPLRPALARAFGGVLGAAGVPRALGPVVRRLFVRAGRAEPRVFGTSRVLRGVLMEYVTYGAVAAELLRLREESPLPEGVPVTVLAAYAGGSRAWLNRQRGLAALLGATFEVAAPSGHLVMLDRPGDVAAAVLRAPHAPSRGERVAGWEGPP